MNKKNTEINSKYYKFIDLGIGMIKSNDYDNAKKYLLKATKLNPKNYEAYINLSNLYILQKKIDLSLDVLFGYLNKIGFNEEIANYVAKICDNYNLDNILEKLFEITKLKSKSINKEKKILYFYEGSFFEKKLEFEKAIYSYKMSILSDRFYIKSYFKLLNLLESMNKIDELEKYIFESLKIFKGHKDLSILHFFQSLFFFRKKKYEESKKVITTKKLYDHINKFSRYHLQLIDLDSKINEKLKNYKYSFERITTRNNIIKTQENIKNFNTDNIIKNFESYKKFYNNKNISNLTSRLDYSNNSNLVFLVGFPRSGTTLLDSILRSHSKIMVLEEKPFLLEIRHKFFNTNKNNLYSLKNLKQNEKDKMVEDYFKKIGHIKKNTKIVIDKLPLSITEIGFIKCIFPDSKIILSIRHPCDVIISCFFSSFKINDAMLNFLDWNSSIKFYNEVFNLFEFYEREIRLNYYKIRYEDIVQDFENQIKNLLNFLNLDYESQVNDFFITAKNRERISTPSYSQVINPIYSTSIGRWKNFKKIKNPEKQLSKWIKKFNY